MDGYFLDCKGLNCPMPIVRLSQAMRSLASGARLVIEADDPAFRADVEAWVRRFGHTLVSFEAGSVQRAVLLEAVDQVDGRDRADVLGDR